MNILSKVGPEIYSLVITGKLELVFTPRQLIWEIDVKIMFSNEGI